MAPSISWCHVYYRGNYFYNMDNKGCNLVNSNIDMGTLTVLVIALIALLYLLDSGDF